jgi:hypothetical protein
VGTTAFSGQHALVYVYREYTNPTLIFRVVDDVQNLLMYIDTPLSGLPSLVCNAFGIQRNLSIAQILYEICICVQEQVRKCP